MTATKSEIPRGLLSQCELWLKWDKNPRTRDEIQELMSKSDAKELSRRLETRISFGTAGLRSSMRAGFAHMNELTVIQASQGLAVYLESTIPDSKTAGISIGFDGRHNSRSFAQHAAVCFLHRGFKVYLFSEPVCTPMVSYSVLCLKLATGIVVTASHNPKEDNGYKVYWNNGVQIVEPHDVGICGCIEKNLEPWVDFNVPASQQLSSPAYAALLEDPTERVLSSYFEAIKRWRFVDPAVNASRSLRITYTAMHGVGAPFVMSAFKAFGLQAPIPVLEQNEPDPDFPTVVFPNPEEGKGALKLAIDTAERNNSPLIVANDPDADRLAVAERDPRGTWRVFTGNEVGILLADYIYTKYTKRDGIPASQLILANSTVSSHMLHRLADVRGCNSTDTLTGFKWIASAVLKAIADRHLKHVFSFEESIGYMIGDVCWDKDGVSAAAVCAEMASELYANGSTLSAQLEALSKELGTHITRNGYFFCYDPAVMKQVFDDIRHDGKYVSEIEGFVVKAVRDLTTPGYDSAQPDHRPILPISSGTQMITFTFDVGVLTLRGSGTEPKLKYYVEAYGSEPGEVARNADNILRGVRKLLQPEKFGLVEPRKD